MAVTAQDMIYRSLRMLGVLASGEAPTASEAQDALYALNSLIDSFMADPQYYYFTDDDVYTLTTKAAYAIGNSSVSVTSITRSTTTATVTTPVPHNLVTGNSITVSGAVQTEYNITASITVTSPTTFTYTMANSGASPATGTPVYTTADFYAARPIRIVGAFTRSGSNVDTPIGIITEQFWNNIPDKTTSGAAPTKVLYRPASPFGQIIVWPVPSGSLSLHLRTENMISTYSTLTTTQFLPPGYQAMLELALAVTLASEYGARVEPQNAAYLRETLNQVMRTNLGKLPSSKPGAIPNSNIYSDTTIAGSQALQQAQG